VPEAWQLIAYLCTGYPVDESDEPLLQRAGWEERCDMGTFLHTR